MLLLKPNILYPHTEKGSQQPIHSPLVEAEKEEAVQSKNTTRVNIVRPLLAARRIKPGTNKESEAEEGKKKGKASPSYSYYVLSEGRADSKLHAQVLSTR